MSPQVTMLTTHTIIVSLADGTALLVNHGYVMECTDFDAAMALSQHLLYD